MENEIKKVFIKTVNSSIIYEAFLLVENSKGDFSQNFGYGGREINSPMIIASITKMFTAACIIKFCENKKISLENRISEYFGKELLSGLHIYRGQEYSSNLRIYDLLFQTSGLPDEFESSNKKVSKIWQAIIERDVYSNFNKTVEDVKKLEPHFAPNRKKAYYSNINFDLLGEILEKITEQSLAEIYKKFIFEPLQMVNTYLPTKDNEFVPYIYYKDKKLVRPKLIASCRASGGCVSTAKDLLIFSKAFWEGKLFDKKIFKELSVYRKLQISKGPIYYGGGFMKINTGGLMTMFMGKGELLGHSGSTGSFAFYYPNKELYFIGDLNQMVNPAIPIRLLLQLVMAIV